LARDFEDKLIKLVWRSRATMSVISSGAPSSISPSTASYVNLAEKSKDTASATGLAVVPDREKPKPVSKKIWGFNYFRSSRKTESPVGEAGDVEKSPPGKTPRPIRLLAPLYGGLGAALALCELTLSVFSVSVIRIFGHALQYLSAQE
jgi:hypothetical protein